MREILFKAKRINNGEWVEGFVSRPFSRNAEGNITNYCFNALDEMGFVSECIVSADTICQYTGLTDKNGNKIWENDIVLFEEEICTVSWSDKDAQFTIESEFVVENFGNVWSADCEVYGNLFDNPELVEGGEIDG